MTRKSLLPLFLLLTIAMFISCKEDTYADWKILNDSKYAAELAITDFTKKESGLNYHIIDSGQGKKPNLTSEIQVKYVGKLLLTNEVFDSRTTSLYLSEMIPAWQEAIPKIRVGGNIEFFCTYDLGYGSTGKSTIPPYSILYFNVELLDAIN